MNPACEVPFVESPLQGALFIARRFIAGRRAEEAGFPDIRPRPLPAGRTQLLPRRRASFGRNGGVLGLGGRRSFSIVKERLLAAAQPQTHPPDPTGETSGRSLLDMRCGYR